MTRAQALKHGAERLAQVGIDRPRREARLLLAHALGVSREVLMATPGVPVDDAQSLPLPPAGKSLSPGCDRGVVAWSTAGEGAVGGTLTRFRSLLDRRSQREPLALILGRREFWSLDFAVSPATLIPRPESETLVEAAIASFRMEAPPRSVLDLGTGTGCLLLAVLHEFPAAFGVAIDREPASITLAKRNAAMLGLTRRTAFVVGDWATAIGSRFDLILSNPPYIASAEIDQLMPEVSRYEPRSALDGGADGLAAYRAILPTLQDLLTESGRAVLEMGIDQAGPIQALAVTAGLTTSIRTDLAGIPRAALLRRHSP